LAPALLKGRSPRRRFERSIPLSAKRKPLHPGTTWPRLMPNGSRKLSTVFPSSIRARSLRLVWLRIPGCYATSVILALRPLTQAGLLAPAPASFADGKSRRKRCGKDPSRDLQLRRSDENFKAYGLFTHRHTPEILEHTGLSESQVVFSTHLLPLARGILSTIYSRSASRKPPRTSRPLPQSTPAVPWSHLGCARCRIAARRAYEFFGKSDSRSTKSGAAWSSSPASTNLGKALAGQAVQNFNHMLGIEEQTSFNEIVIKFAGALLEDDDTVRALAQQVAHRPGGHENSHVHGGGRLFTPPSSAWLSRASSSLACASPTANADVAVMVFAGLLNKSSPRRSPRKGSRPSVSLPRTLGVSSPSPWCTTKSKAVWASSLSHRTERAIHRISLARKGFCRCAGLGLGPDNELYKSTPTHGRRLRGISRADQLIYLTTSPRSRWGEGFSVVTCEEMNALVQCRGRSGGMVLKLEAASVPSKAASAKSASSAALRPGLVAGIARGGSVRQ